MASGPQPNRPVSVEEDRRSEQDEPLGITSGASETSSTRPPDDGAGKETGASDNGGHENGWPPGDLAYDLLVKAIMEVPLPGAPPHGQQHGAEIGLAFVDGALRQNHVRRISESLRLVEHGAALLTVRVDLSLSLLNDGQYRAGKSYSGLRGMNNGAHTLTRPESEDTLVWVPVTRLSRRRVSPVEVRDAHGTQVPRLTQDETGQLMAPAMYRLLRSILDSDPDATREGTPLDRFLHWDDRARWVLQRALIALTTERANPAPRRADTVCEEELATDDASARHLAIRVLCDKRKALADYFQLLEIVINDYFVIVGLSDAEDEHTLTYRSALESASNGERSRRQKVGDRLRVIRNAGNAYDVKYRSNLSTGVRSYHFAAETDLELSIDPPYLTTDFDQERADDLIEDMGFLAREMERQGPHRDRIIDLEIGSALGRLGEIMRRRHWEADQVGRVLSGTTAPACHRLRGFVLDPANRAGPDESRYPEVTPALLRDAVAEIAGCDLGSDISAEKDPPSSQAHAYWRKPLEGHASSLTTIDVTCNVRITDAADGGPRNVGVFVFGIAVLNLLIAFVLFGRMGPWDSALHATSAEKDITDHADALVGVLLLLPGFIYTRLRLPAPGTIAGRLRRFTRSVAYLVIGSSAVVGVMVAAGARYSTVETTLWASSLLGVLCCLLLFLDHQDRAPVPTPEWARQHRKWWQRRKPRRPDVRFNGVGLHDEL